MYNEKYHPKIKNDIRKLDYSIKEPIKAKYIPEILKDPQIGNALIGDLNGIYSYHFKIGKYEYRVAYVIDEELKTVFFLMIGKRENFYTLLKRRIK